MKGACADRQRQISAEVDRQPRTMGRRCSEFEETISTGRYRRGVDIGTARPAAGEDKGDTDKSAECDDREPSPDKKR